MVNNSKHIKKVGSLTIIDNGPNGFSWQRIHTDNSISINYEFGKISMDDILKYDMSELLPYHFDITFKKEEKKLFINEYNRIKHNLLEKKYENFCKES